MAPLDRMMMPEAVSTGSHPADKTADRCANCAHVLAGPFCAACGQEARNLHRPFYALVGEAIGDVFDVDARWARTLGPLLLAPGEVTRRYRRGHRVAYVPPLKTYLIAALVFFGLFTVFQVRDTGREEIVSNAAAARGARTEGGSNVTFELPERLPVFNAAYQRAAAKARANPTAFFSAFYDSIPRLFFVLFPLFALYLELFYRKDGYYGEHLVFSLYYHAFAFTMLSLLFLVRMSTAWTPWWLGASIAAAGATWIIVHLPLALQRVYGGPKWKTALKVSGLLALYLLSAVALGLAVLPMLVVFTL
jgi:hypothetical protein